MMALHPVSPLWAKRYICTLVLEVTLPYEIPTATLDADSEAPQTGVGACYIPMTYVGISRWTIKKCNHSSA